MATLKTYINNIEKAKTQNLEVLSEKILDFLLYLNDSSKEQFLDYHNKYYGIHPLIDKAFDAIKGFKGYSNYVGCWYLNDSPDVNTLWFLHWIFASPIRACVSCEGYSQQNIETVQKYMNLNNQALKTLPYDLLKYLNESPSVFKPIGGGGYQMVGDTSFKTTHTKKSSYLYNELIKTLYKTLGNGILTIKAITPNVSITSVSNETKSPNAEKRTITTTKTGEYITPRFNTITNSALKPKGLEY